MLKDNKLEKFTKNKNKKKIITISVITFVLLIGVITLYRTFALYEEKLEFNLIQGKVPEYTSGDVSIAAIIDGEKSSTIPSKNDGYEFVSVECNNGAEAEWNNDTWKITIGNLSKSKTICTLTFKTKEQTSGSVGVDYITNLAETNPEEIAYDGTADNNLRYIGANPNNYVKFNNELWRIIGVMNNITDSEGNVGSHIKIIRNESIGSYSWDNKASGVGSSTSNDGSNDWTDSALMNVLNNGAYYNKTSGSCPYGRNGATEACDFSSNGLTEETKRMIANVVWKLGGHTTSKVTASTIYGYERGTKVYSEHATEWTGRIGLMYPSDYGYAVGGSPRTTCLGANLSDYYKNNCCTNDWLYKSGEYQWTLMPFSSVSNDVYNVLSQGHVNNYYYVSNVLAVLPVLYLASNVEIIGGDGTQENAFELSVQ